MSVKAYYHRTNKCTNVPETGRQEQDIEMLPAMQKFRGDEGSSAI
jgi:hypothetical protein